MKTEGKPFLRWAGGKNWLVRIFDEFLPKEFNNYHEPFLGGGSIFISLKNRDKINQKAYLSDSNKDLILTYNTIKKYPERLIEELSTFENTKEYYYECRSMNFDDEIQKAAQFIFLNRTSFNGIYRVNLEGKYNVPYGFKKYNQLFDFDNIKTLSESFKNCFFRNVDFQRNIYRINPGDLVFIDPPYTVAHENNGFVKYNQKIFAWEDQIRLREFLLKIDSMGAYYIMTNAHHKSIIDLFKKSGNFEILSRPSLIGGLGAKRTKYNEIILKNF